VRLAAAQAAVQPWATSGLMPADGVGQVKRLRVLAPQDALVTQADRRLAILSKVAEWSGDPAPVPADAEVQVSALIGLVGESDGRVQAGQAALVRLAAARAAVDGLTVTESLLPSAPEIVLLQRLSPQDPRLAPLLGRIQAAQEVAQEAAWLKRWSSATGTDSVGRWADVTVGTLVQRFRYISPGTFTMGSPEGEADRNANEKSHPVTISRGYWLAESECTQALYESVMGSNPSYFTGDANRPVELVSWDDVQAFVSKLNGAKNVSVFGLPSEAQWEYACRAGTTTAFHGASLGAVGWYEDNSGKTTHAVKQKPANAWGLFDMHGNVWEWCSDWLGDYAPGAVSDPIGPASGSYRVDRGGSWDNYARNCRSADRKWGVPGSRYSHLGFRLCAQSTP